jgi:hypothetical protein
MVGGMCARALDEANTNTGEDPVDLVRIDPTETACTVCDNPVFVSRWMRMAISGGS